MLISKRVWGEASRHFAGLGFEVFWPDLGAHYFRRTLHPRVNLADEQDATGISLRKLAGMLPTPFDCRMWF